MTVLVVEDDVALSELLRNVLGRRGMSVEIADRGETAVAAIESGPDRYDTVILDLMLPGLSGTEVLQSIHERNPELLSRVIVLTAVSTAVLKRLPFTASVWRVLRKPFDLSELLEVVRACVDRHAGAAQ